MIFVITRKSLIFVVISASCINLPGLPHPKGLAMTEKQALFFN